VVADYKATNNKRSTLNNHDIQTKFLLGLVVVGGTTNRKAILNHRNLKGSTVIISVGTNIPH
jgi:hypothetical protein